uniref:Uncharacterized protein n=1 Tax=Alexandrium monilatum TaxID=311494 RepID=A0A7S4RAI7_9DINO
MGAEGSTFCSVSSPAGYLDTDSMCSCAPAGNKFESKRMHVMSANSIHADRINPWTKDLLASNSCGTCGSNAIAPTGYLADTPDHGAIVLDSRHGPLWVDDDKDSRPVDLDPEEESNMRIPEVVARIKGAPNEDAHDKALSERRRGSSSGGSNPP